MITRFKRDGTVEISISPLACEALVCGLERVRDLATQEGVLRRTCVFRDMFGRTRPFKLVLA